MGGVGPGSTTRASAWSRLGCGSGVGSAWSPDTVATLVNTVPFAVEAGTVVTIVSVSDEPAAGIAGTLGAVQTIAPLESTGGAVHVSAGLAVRLLNATPTGNWSDSTKPVEVAGP